MKFLLLLLLAAAGYYGYRHYFAQPEPRLAPPGIFFTTERFSEKTDYGVRALKAGVRVKLLRQDNDFSVVVDDNNNEFRVPSRILTNDLDARDALLKSAAENQEKARKISAAEAQSGKQARDERIKSLNDGIKKIRLRIDELSVARARAEDDLKVETAKSDRSGVSGNPMMGERAVRERIARIDAEIKLSQQKIEDTELAIKRERLAN